MIRLIAKVGNKWAMDFEWGFLDSVDSAEAEIEHDTELVSETRIAEEDDWVPEDSMTPVARKVRGFQPNKEVTNG